MLRPTADDDVLRNNMAAADMMVSILTTVAVCEDVSMHSRLQGRARGYGRGCLYVHAAKNRRHRGTERRRRQTRRARIFETQHAT